MNCKHPPAANENILSDVPLCLEECFSAEKNQLTAQTSLKKTSTKQDKKTGTVPDECRLHGIMTTRSRRVQHAYSETPRSHAAALPIQCSAVLPSCVSTGFTLRYGEHYSATGNKPESPTWEHNTSEVRVMSSGLFPFGSKNSNQM